MAQKLGGNGTTACIDKDMALGKAADSALETAFDNTAGRGGTCGNNTAGDCNSIRMKINKRQSNAEMDVADRDASSFTSVISGKSATKRGFAYVHPFVALGAALVTFVFFVAIDSPLILAAVMVLLAMLECLFRMGGVLLRTGFVFLPTALFLGCMLHLVTGEADSSWMMALRFCAIWISSTLMLSVPPMAFVRILRQVQAPRVLTLTILITLRYVYVLFGQIAIVLVSWRTLPRGKGRKIGWSRISVPLVARALAISDSLSNALMLRCFSLNGVVPVTIYKQVTFRVWDALFIVLLVSILGISGAYQLLQ